MIRSYINDSELTDVVFEQNLCFSLLGGGGGGARQYRLCTSTTPHLLVQKQYDIIDHTCTHG